MQCAHQRSRGWVKGGRCLEGIVAKRLADAYHPKRARWHKVLNLAYSQRRGRAEWFRESRGRR
jgi:hypothetical protein